MNADAIAAERARIGRFSGRPKLVTMTLAAVMEKWRPGSHDTADGPEGANVAWTWQHEAADLFTDQRERTLAILDRVWLEGIGFIDYVSPILLGNDGRVWDGHHRIVIAHALMIPFVDVEVA